jgi:hypothetical protein
MLAGNGAGLPLDQRMPAGAFPVESVLTMTSGSRYRTRSSAVRLVSVLLVIWLIIGAIAAGQRHYYSGSDTNCAKASTVAVTILAGPLNYVGVNPKIKCHVPQPSK